MKNIIKIKQNIKRFKLIFENNDNIIEFETASSNIIQAMENTFKYLKENKYDESYIFQKAILLNNN